MKSVSIVTPGKVAIKEIEKPVLQQGSAILKILYGGICGSDLGTYKGTFLYADYPRIPGHEFSAEIVEIEENSQGLKKGMVVTANPYFNCGHCYSCRRGLVNCCMHNETMGAQRDGAFCEYIRMPVDCVYDGKGIDAKTLVLVEPCCIAYHAVMRANIKLGEKVLVVGGGTIGYLAAACARLMGGQVYVADVSPKKLEYAKQLGVAGTILNTSPEAFANSVEQITNGDGFDVCIEAVGLPSTFLNCVEAVAYRQRVVVVGVGKQNVNFFYSVIQKKELEIFGSRNARKEDFLNVIELIHDGKLSLNHVISAVYPFEQAGKAFEDFANNSADMLKVILDFT